MHRKAKIPFPAGFLRRRFSPCRPGSEAGAPGAVAPCIGKPKSPSPPGSCAVGSAHAARVQPRGCKGRSPLHKKTKNLPLPAGKGVGGMGAKSTDMAENSQCRAGLVAGVPGAGAPGKIKQKSPPSRREGGSGGWGQEGKQTARSAGGKEGKPPPDTGTPPSFVSRETSPPFPAPFHVKHRPHRFT